MATPYDSVVEFENTIAEYAGAKYGIAVDCCSHAIFLSALYNRIVKGIDRVVVPKQTYISVPMQLRHAGFTIDFIDQQWQGRYCILPTNIVDSACRFTSGMYIPETLYCLSFQFHKTLSTVRGGMILTDNEEEVKWIRPRVHDGRDMNIKYEQDDITCLGYHMHMTPESAKLGLEKFNSIIQLHNKDVCGYEYYHDISYVNNLS
tara:strand:+ start:540 stop:1151 length:612 start_codon:yes stop_codon:yes gene_type:complete